MSELQDVNNAEKMFLLCFKTNNKEFYNKVKASCLECMEQEEPATENKK